MKRTPDHVRGRVGAMLAQGLSWDLIASSMGVGRRTVARIAKDERAKEPAPSSSNAA
jgi:DNA invertase Pin-like site-specific DNA recombinase